MTLSELKEYTPQQQEELYSAFYSAYSAAPMGTALQRQYESYLRQLQSIFGHTDSEYHSILARCTAKQFAVETFLQEFMEAA